MKLLAAVTFAALLTSASAFVSSKARSSRPASFFCQAKTKRLLNDDMDSMCMQNTARFCLDQECSYDDKDAIINTLLDQRTTLSRRDANFEALVRKLRASFDTTLHSVDEATIESLMKSVGDTIAMEDSHLPGEQDFQ